VIIPIQQEQNNGEGSLVRFRMAGCGPVDLSSKRILSVDANRRFEENLSPRSFIFMLLSEQPLTQKQLAQRLGLTTRAVRYILSDLMKKGSILQRASLLDARSKLYYLKPSLAWPRGTLFRSARQSLYEVKL